MQAERDDLAVSGDVSNAFELPEGLNLLSDSIVENNELHLPIVGARRNDVPTARTERVNVCVEEIDDVDEVTITELAEVAAR